MYISSVLRCRYISLLTRYNFNALPVTMGVLFTENVKAVIDEAPLAEADKPADNAPIGAAKPTDAHFDSEPMLGTIFSRSAVHPSNSYDDRHISVPPFLNRRSRGQQYSS